MVVKLFLINALADGPFSGGRAAVAILRRLGQEGSLQALARELNQPVTAFVLPGHEAFMVRYFSPEGELERADYAALAAAWALYGAGLAPADRQVALLGRGGRRMVERDPVEGDRLALPLEPAALSRPAGAETAASLGLSPDEVAGIFIDGQGGQIICCRSAAPLRRVASAGRVEPWPAAWSGLTLSAPPEPAEDRAAGLVLAFDSAGRPAGPPLDLAPLAAVARFWAEKMGRGDLTIRYQGARTCLFRVELAGRSLTVSGRLATILRADPVAAELTGGPPPEFASA